MGRLHLTAANHPSTLPYLVRSMTLLMLRLATATLPGKSKLAGYLGLTSLLLPMDWYAVLPAALHAVTRAASGELRGERRGTLCRGSQGGKQV